jgi:hypothetical protein
MTSPVRPSRPGAENVARASPFSRSRSAEKVVPASSNAAGAADAARSRPIVPSAEPSMRTVLAVLAVVTAAARISLGSVSAGSDGAL